MNDTADTATPADRPLWRKVWEFPLVAMIVALALVTLAIVGVQYLMLLVPETMDEDLRAVIGGVVGVLAVFVVYKLAIRHLGAVRKDDLPLAGALGDTALGLGAGAAIFGVVVGIAAVLGAYRILGWGSGEDAVQFIMAGGVVAGFVEEVIFRGILFRWVEEFGGSWLALLVSSLFFGLAHAQNPNATWFSSLAIAVEAGVLLGGAYMLTRSLWLAVGIHAGWNVTQGMVFDVPVSGFEVDGWVEADLYGSDLMTGGAFGLEASVIALVVATAAGVWMVWQAKKEGNVVAPMWMRKG